DRQAALEPAARRSQSFRCGGAVKVGGTRVKVGGTMLRRPPDCFRVVVQGLGHLPFAGADHPEEKGAPPVATPPPGVHRRQRPRRPLVGRGGAAPESTVAEQTEKRGNAQADQYQTIGSSEPTMSREPRATRRQSALVASHGSILIAS